MCGIMKRDMIMKAGLVTLVDLETYISAELAVDAGTVERLHAFHPVPNFHASIFACTKVYMPTKSEIAAPNAAVWQLLRSFPARLPSAIREPSSRLSGARKVPRGINVWLCSVDREYWDPAVILIKAVELNYFQESINCIIS